MSKKSYKKALTIAGSDSGGGAGIQADLKTFSALGCYGMSVITAVTAQNTYSVTGIQKIEPEIVEKQIRAVLDDIGADAVKIGMLFSADIVRVVADCLKEYSPNNIVLDPVMISKSGDKLLQDDAVTEMKEHLLPIATVITPNTEEVYELTGIRIQSEDDLTKAAQLMMEAGSRHVLIKGGHMSGEGVNDYLFSRDNGGEVSEMFPGKRVHSQNKHGTGCTYSSALCAFLAHGHPLPEAVGRAKKYINTAIESGAAYSLGTGHGPVDHFFAFK